MYHTASKINELISIEGLINPSSQTFAGGIPLRRVGMRSAYLNWQMKTCQLMLQYKLMQHCDGAAVPSLIISSFNGSGQKSGNK